MHLRMLGSLLSIHRETLQTLDIGYLTQSTTAMIDVSTFPNLRYLKLSRWSFPQALEFSEAEAQLLLAPRLKTFGWDFSIMDQHSEEWTDFGKREEQWLKDFGIFSSSYKSQLQKIEITFRPANWSTTKADGYPWERMDSVREHIRQVGVALEYNLPEVTKERWLEYVEEASTCRAKYARTQQVQFEEEGHESTPLVPSIEQDAEL
jgi:hypothetical protein